MTLKQGLQLLSQAGVLVERTKHYRTLSANVAINFQRWEIPTTITIYKYSIYMYIGFKGTSPDIKVILTQSFWISKTPTHSRKTELVKCVKRVQKNHTGAYRFEVNELFFSLWNLRFINSPFALSIYTHCYSLMRECSYKQKWPIRQLLTIKCFSLRESNSMVAYFWQDDIIFWQVDIIFWQVDITSDKST